MKEWKKPTFTIKRKQMQKQFLPKKMLFFKRNKLQALVQPERQMMCYMLLLVRASGILVLFMYCIY